MRDQVIFRPKQQLIVEDLSNVQKHVRTGFDELIKHGVGTANRYVGFTATQTGPAALTVAPGWLYLTGPVHARLTETPMDLLPILPNVAKKKAVIAGWGDDHKTDIERRNFRINVQTQEAEPQDVEMRHERFANVQIIEGDESVAPVIPVVAAQYVAIAVVTLTSAGIESIEMIEENRLRSIEEVLSIALANEAWRKLADPLLSTIRTDVAALAEELRDASTRKFTESLAYDVALLKEVVGVDEDAVAYGADRYLTDDEMDLDHAQSDCRIEEGLRFTWEATETAALALFNPLNAEVSVDAATGLLLPAYSEVERNEVSGFAGDIGISQYPSQTVQTVQLFETRTRVRYGQSRRVCTNSNWWRSGNYDVARGIFRRDGEAWEVAEEDRARAATNHRFIRLTQFWTDSWQVPYEDHRTVTVEVTGAVIAQTFLNAQGGLYLGSSFEFTDVDTDGAVTMLLCETDAGAPDVVRVVASVTKPAAELQQRPARTRFGVKPVYLERGKRYSRVLISQGAHRLAIADRNSYQEGSLFASTDGAWFSGDLVNDLVGVDHFCRFDRVRTVVEFQSISLAGGITDLDMLFDNIIPEGTEIAWEIQPEGVAGWTPLRSGTGQSLLHSKPGQVKIRAVFVGTSDVQPMLRMTDSVFTAMRSASAGVGISEEITLPAPSSQITITSYLEEFVEANHDATISLIDDTDTQIAASVVSDTPADRGIRRKATFNLGGPTASFRMRHDIVATSELDLFHVNETVWNAH